MYVYAYDKQSMRKLLDSLGECPQIYLQKFQYQNKCIPGGKVRAFPALFMNIRGETRDIRAPNHAEITRNARPSTCDDSTRYACTYRYEKH